MLKNLDIVIKSTGNDAIVMTKKAKEANLNNEMCAVILTEWEQRGTFSLYARWTNTAWKHGEIKLTYFSAYVIFFTDVRIFILLKKF